MLLREIGYSRRRLYDRLSSRRRLIFIYFLTYLLVVSFAIADGLSSAEAGIQPALDTPRAGIYQAAMLVHADAQSCIQIVSLTKKVV